MWLVRLTFISLFFVVLFDQIDESDSKPFENFFIRGPDECRSRCISKHGYFVDQTGDIRPVTTSKIRFKVKCSCRPSSAFRSLVRVRYGRKKAYTQWAWSIIGRGVQSRAKLSKIKFVPASEYQQRMQAGRMSQSQGRCSGGSCSPLHAHTPSAGGKSGGGGGGGGGGMVYLEAEAKTTEEAERIMAQKIAEMKAKYPDREYRVVDMTPEQVAAYKASRVTAR